MMKETDIVIEHFESRLMRIKRTPYKSKGQIIECHKDLYISNRKVVEDWWRKEGHNLCLEDIRDISVSKPSVLIVGTGTNGKMKISQEVKSFLAKREIPLIVAPTEWAAKVYNCLRVNTQNIAAAFHLTC